MASARRTDSTARSENSLALARRPKYASVSDCAERNQSSSPGRPAAQGQLLLHGFLVSTKECRVVETKAKLPCVQFMRQRLLERSPRILGAVERQLRRRQVS